MNYEIKVKKDLRGCFNEEIINEILFLKEVEDIEEFLYPDETHIYSLTNLKRIDEAAQILLNNLDKTVGIYADVDTDGISSSVMLYRYLKEAFGIEANVYINDGKNHGVMIDTATKIINNDVKCLIVVDSLNAKLDEYQYLKDNDVKVIVLDHHDVTNDYSNVITLVSSNIDYDNPELSGAGVVWKFICYIDKLVDKNFAFNYVDLAATGILADVCDVSVNCMENRAIVNLGLNNVVNPTISKLIGNKKYTSKDVLFNIAPLINSGNRYNHNIEAFWAFASDDNKIINKNLKVLKECKESQKAEVDQLMTEIEVQIEKQINNNVLFCEIDTENGISGLLAGKITGKYKKPSIVVKHGDYCLVGSLRSIGRGDFKQKCQDTNLCQAVGHSEAAGFSCKHTDKEAFLNSIEQTLSQEEAEIISDVDIRLDVEDINADLVYDMMRLDRISGKNCSQIKVVVDVKDYEVSSMSQGKHLVLDVGYGLKFIQWNFNGDWDVLEEAAMCGETISCVGTLTCDYIGGYGCKLIIEDYFILD